MNEGIYLTDTERRIIFWSKGAERITGWRAEEVIGKRCADSVLEHIDKDDHRLCTTAFCPLYRSIKTEQRTTVPFVVYGLTSTGRRIPMQVTTAPYYDDSGRLIGGVEVFRDLREQIADMEEATRIQHDSCVLEVPESSALKVHAVCHSLDLVGGDFYMVQPVEPDDESRIAVLLADVIGHGVSAALYTLMIRLLWEEHRSLLNRPVEFLSVLHRSLSGHADTRGHLGTALCGYFDLSSSPRRFVYGSAAHPPFLHLSADGTVTEHRTAGTLLGLGGEAAGIPEEEGEVDLQPGDKLLLFTDGAFEVVGKEEQIYGIRRLEEFLRTHGTGAGPDAKSASGDDAFLQELEQELVEFSRGVSLPDDFTVLLFSLA